MELAQALPDTRSADSGQEHWVDAIGLQFRSFLKQARDTLRAAASGQEADDVRVVKDLEPRLGPPFHRFILLLDQVPERIAPGRMPAVRRRLQELLLDVLIPAPVFRQSFLEPFSSAGDSLALEIACADPYQGETAYAKFLNRMFCELAVSRAAISRLDYLRRWIAYAVHDSGRQPARILSLACGPAREMGDYLASNAPGKELVVSLLDRDARALAFAQAALAPFAGHGRPLRVAPVHAAADDLVRTPGRFVHLAGQLLIYSAGLLDSLPAGAAGAVLRALFALLAPGGVLVAGNLSPRCDSRGFLESVAGRQRIYRTDEDLLGLAAGIPAAPSIERDATGVNGFLVLWR